MKRFGALLSFILIIGLIYYSFSSLMPNEGASLDAPKTEFSTDRALIHLKEITKAPHYIGSPEHTRVREYLVKALEQLGLEVEIQEGFVFNERGARLDKPKNIIAKIKGSENGKSLVVFSHYDSALTPSFGASDAGSGVVTILESLRAYNASGKTPKNDIIFLFTDAEEIGLDGARLFVNEHPWAKNVGLALNFEARGSGGPSSMIVETNGGNKNLINAFIEANPDYPVASSLLYSIYKKLPNDTDSTVFREDGNIDGFFFAFIDDHYDYHTGNDSYENLDRNTLQHQGSYLLPLLHYFADADLSNLKADEDYVYANMPLIKMISYPFSWVLPMLLVAFVIFILLVFFGIKKGVLNLKQIGKGFLPFLASIIAAILIGYLWEIILKIYPEYNEIQHGFTYNGHIYIAMFVALTIAFLFMFYRRFAKKITKANLFIAPLFFWLIINTLIFMYLKGAAYFIIPVFFGLLSLWILIRQEKPNLLLMALLAAPAIFVFAPLIQFFPVGLGLEFLMASCMFTVLLFGLLIPVVGFYNGKRMLSIAFFVLALGLFINAHFKSDFSSERQKPNSLVFYQDEDSNNSYWLTYDDILDDWTKGYLGESPEEASKYIENVAGSKYSTRYTYASITDMKDIPKFDVILKQDTLINDLKKVTFVIKPNRTINQLNLYVDKEVVFNSLSFNGKEVKKDTTQNYYHNRSSNYLLRYYVSDNDSLEVSYTTSKNNKVAFTIKEYSFDLLSNNQFSITKRPENTMAKPFIVTDAVVIKNTFDVDLLEMKPVVIDSVSTN